MCFWAFGGKNETRNCTIKSVGWQGTQKSSSMLVFFNEWKTMKFCIEEI